MILSSVSEILLRMQARINVGSIPDFLFQCSSVLLGLLQFISTVFKKTQPTNQKKTQKNQKNQNNNPTTTKQFHLRRVEKEEQKIMKLSGK